MCLCHLLLVTKCKQIKSQASGNLSVIQLKCVCWGSYEPNVSQRGNQIQGGVTGSQRGKQMGPCNRYREKETSAFVVTEDNKGMAVKALIHGGEGV